MDDATPLSLPLPMKPVQALSAGFVMDAALTAGALAQQTGLPGVASLFSRPVGGGSSVGLSAKVQGSQQRQGFRVGEIGLMIRYDDGSELVDLQPLAHLPNTPGWLMGIVNLHGRLVPVFDLPKYLNTSKLAAGDKQMLLVLSSGDAAAGIIIDGLPQRLSWTAEQQINTEAAPDRLQPIIRAACLLNDGKIWFDLDCTALRDSLESSLERLQ